MNNLLGGLRVSKRGYGKREGEGRGRGREGERKGEGRGEERERKGEGEREKWGGSPRSKTNSYSIKTITFHNAKTNIQCSKLNETNPVL